jgi:multidrug resistance efflux pump
VLIVAKDRTPVPVPYPEQLPAQSTLSPPGAPAKPARRFRVALRWALALIVLALLVAPAFLWFDYNKGYVTSSNAIVRGHLAEIGSQVDGVIAHVNLDAGDRVKANQVLAMLEDSRFRAEADAAKAALAGLERSIEVERLAIAHDRKLIAQQELEAKANEEAAKAHAKAAEVRAEDARKIHEVRRALFKSGGLVSSEDVRATESKWRAAQAMVQAARAEYHAVHSAGETTRLSVEALTVREHKIGVLEAEASQAVARLARVQADLISASIRAPSEGAIVRRIVQPGGSVKVGQPIISMWLGRELWIEAWIDEADIGAVRLGSDATIKLQSFPDQEFAGEVVKIGLSTDFEMPESEVPQPRFARMRGAPVVGVRIRYRDPPAGLVPGLSAEVAIRKPAE